MRQNSASIAGAAWHCACRGLNRAMSTVSAPRRSSHAWKGLLPRALGLLAAAMATGLVFAAWQTNGPALLNALAANALAWCL